MKINIYKNKYDHAVVDCPFCQRFSYVRKATKASPDQLRDLKRHITNQAKNEALEYHVTGDGASIKHLAYYKEHTHPKIIQDKRQYDNDLSS